MTDAAIKAIIDQGVADALVEIKANRTSRMNSHVKTVGHDAAYRMPWKTLKKMITAKYCQRVDTNVFEDVSRRTDEVEKYVSGL
ncbi:hypothetical protein Tco_1264539 [Tanacetum coccineum]